MIIEGCARGVVLLLLVSSSFSSGFDNTSKTLDASVDDPVLTSAPEDEVKLQSSASNGDDQRMDEGGAEGGNATSDGKESRHFYGQFQAQYVYQEASTTAVPLAITNTRICLLFATNAGITSPTALQAYLQQCAALLGLINAPTTTAPTTTAPTTTAAPTPPVTGICQLLAANAGITSPIALQTYLQQCALLLGLITAPTTTAPTTTAAPTTAPSVTGICQLLAANAGITSPTALQAYLQQCALLLGLITAPTTTAPTTTAAPTTAPSVTSVCQLLAANAGITSPTALQAYLQQCAALLG